MPAPVGNTNARKGFRWRDALVRALETYATPTIAAGQALNEIARNVVEKALVEGDKDAIAEIANRLDGKAPQGITISGDDENPLSLRRIVEFRGKPNGHDNSASAGETGTTVGKTPL